MQFAAELLIERDKHTSLTRGIQTEKIVATDKSREETSFVICQLSGAVVGRSYEIARYKDDIKGRFDSSV
jgi:hypothetical protein